MRLKLVAAGTRLPGWIDEGYREYARRMGPDLPLELVEIGVPRGTAQGARERATQKEGEKMLEALPRGEYLTDWSQARLVDGIGDLLYKPTHIIKSGIGEIELCYEPKDEDNNKTLKKYVRTQWYDCNGTFGAYGSCNGATPGLRKSVMISVGDTKKILASLQKL